MSISRPNDVLDVQTFLLPGLPDADLSTGKNARDRTWPFQLKPTLVASVFDNYLFKM